MTYLNGVHVVSVAYSFFREHRYYVSLSVPYVRLDFYWAGKVNFSLPVKDVVILILIMNGVFFDDVYHVSLH